METRFSIKSSNFRSSIRWTIIVFVYLTVVSLVDTAKSSSNLSVIGENVVRPETTILNFFAKSFDPEVNTVSSDCQRDSAIYRDGLENYKPWALQMYDASTKIPSGLITGNTRQLGNYEECLAAKSDHGFVGKACTAKVHFAISVATNGTGSDENDLDMGDLMVNVALASNLMNWTLGLSVPYEWLWCVPSSCSPRDIAETIEIGLDPLKKSPRVDFIVQIDENSCHTEATDRPILDLADCFYIFVLMLFASLVAISTVYDMVKQRNPEKLDPKDKKHTLFCCFSAYTNGKTLLSVQRGSRSIACLDGLRFLSICWIIYGHTHYLKIVGVNLDLTSVVKMHESWGSFLLLNANIATDTFLLLSGLLLANTELTRKEHNFGRYTLNISNLYVRRYLRLTPSYAIIIGFYATLFYKIGSGPQWNTWVGENRNFCQDNWWTNLLYINNYVNVPNMCMSHSWYLAMDMQLLWISPIFLYPMLANGQKNQMIFLIFLIIGLIASVLAPFFITYFYELTGTMLYYKNQTDMANVYQQIYTRVYTRASPYLLGIGLAYLLRKIKPSNTSMPVSLIRVSWTLAIVCGLAVVFGPRGMYFPDHEYDKIEAAFYAGFHRFVFALAVGWIIVACVFGCAGPVGSLLSSSIWVPLSKLTYPAYLTHYIILLYNAGNARTSEYLRTFGVVQSFFGVLTTTLIISVILSLTFEIPFIRLTNLWYSRSEQASFVSTQPVIAKFQANESTLAIYRSFDDVPTTVSRTYDELIERYKKVSVESSQQSECSQDYISLSKQGSSTSVDLNGTHHRRRNDVVTPEYAIKEINDPRVS